MLRIEKSGDGKRLLLGKDGYAVLFADGKAWVLSSQLPFAKLCSFITIEGALRYDRERVLARYRVLP